MNATEARGLTKGAKSIYISEGLKGDLNYIYKSIEREAKNGNNRIHSVWGIQDDFKEMGRFKAEYLVTQLRLEGYIARIWEDSMLCTLNIEVSW
jgi:hypothetical protein